MAKVHHILTVTIVCLVLCDVHITTAQDTIEMPKMIHEEILPTALYPGNMIDIKLHLRPGIEWFRLNLQENQGDPTSAAIETAMAIRVTIHSRLGQMERDWYSNRARQLASPENIVYGQLKFRENEVFVITIFCMIDTYEVRLNGYQKFIFQHRSGLDLSSFNVIRIMAEQQSIEMCWINFNLELLSIATATSGDTPCDQQVQTSLCDELVCHLFDNGHPMSTSTMPTPTTTQVPDDVVSSLEDMAERICCLHGITYDIDKNGDRSSFQLAADITSELMTWNGNASWDTINQLSDNGPISLLDRLDEVAQVMGSHLEVGEVLRVNTSTISCILESNTLEEFIKKDWIFEPFHNSREQISINRSDLLDTGHSYNNTISILGVAHINITEIFNNHQKGAKDRIVSDVISTTVFTPTGRMSLPASFKRQITNLTGSVDASVERVSLCGFWDDYLNGTESGGWSTAGCQRVDVVDEEYIEDNVGDLVSCYCNHTTNYAILMRIVPIRVRRRRKITTSKPTEEITTANLPTTTSPEPTTPIITTEAVTTAAIAEPTTTLPTTTSPEPTTEVVTTAAIAEPTTTLPTTTSPKPTTPIVTTETLTTETIAEPTELIKHTTTLPTTTSPKPTSPVVTTEAVTTATIAEPTTTLPTTTSPKPTTPIVTTEAVTESIAEPTTTLPTTTSPKPTTHIVTTEAVTAAKSTSFNPIIQVTHDVTSTSNQSATSNVSVINDTIDDYYYYYYYYYPVDPVSDKTLDVLTLIGCIMSIVALIVALLCFIACRHSSLDTERILIHMNLMGSLLAAMTVFLISFLLTSFLIPCKIIAMLLHYLYLVVFSWMLVEGIHLYRLIVTVYGSEKQMAKFYLLLGWGSPLLIVAIASSATQLKGYGVPYVACWLNTEDGFIWAFVAPVCVIMLLNFLVLCTVVKTTVAASTVSSADKMTKVKSGLRSSLVLLPLLGISWGTGLIAHIHVAFQYIFVLMNSFQGVWLVIVCCVMNGEVRDAFKVGIRKKIGRYSGSVSSTGTSTISTSINSGKTGMERGSTMTEVGQ